ncbi:hypothetical protein LTR94_028113, partial [Friedmanniomyces endolithicus]
MTDSDTNLDGPPWEEDDVVERDENTDDMFGAPAAAPAPSASVEATSIAAPAAASIGET